FGGWLPEEVAVRVFRWLAPDDLARAELVCRQWHSLVSLSPASSSLTPWLWRKVHERHFGGPVPTKDKEKSFDQRTFCLHSARLLHKCGLLSTQKRDAFLVGALGSGDERIMELMCAHGAPVPPRMVIAAVRRGSLGTVSVLLRFVVPTQQTESDDGAQPPAAITTPLDPLEALLQGSGTSAETLWHRAAEGGHVSLMARLAKIHQEHSQERYRQLLLSYGPRGYTGKQTTSLQLFNR
ncbi:uncharacterized protein ACA1_176510, partial [Acanthamoeba castellanii str. Neff]